MELDSIANLQCIFAVGKITELCILSAKPTTILNHIYVQELQQGHTPSTFSLAGC